MSFVSEGTVKSIRKARPCDACETMVNVGETAVRWAGVADGDFHAVIYHTDCRAAEIALNKLHGNGWQDDWMSVGRDLEWEDHPWLLAEFPAVAARLNIIAEQVAEEQRVEDERRQSALARLGISQIGARS